MQNQRRLYVPKDIGRGHIPRHAIVCGVGVVDDVSDLGGLLLRDAPDPLDDVDQVVVRPELLEHRELLFQPLGLAPASQHMHIHMLLYVYANACTSYISLYESAHKPGNMQVLLYARDETSLGVALQSPHPRSRLCIYTRTRTPSLPCGVSGHRRTCA